MNHYIFQVHVYIFFKDRAICENAKGVSGSQSLLDDADSSRGGAQEIQNEELLRSCDLIVKRYVTSIAPLCAPRASDSRPCVLSQRHIASRLSVSRDANGEHDDRGLKVDHDQDNRESIGIVSRSSVRRVRADKMRSQTNERRRREREKTQSRSFPLFLFRLLLRELRNFFHRLPLSARTRYWPMTRAR